MFYLDFWRNYFSIKGRTRRRDFFLTLLVNFVITILFFNLGPRVFPSNKAIFDLFFQIWVIVTQMPYLTMLTRRLHDTGRSGVYLLWLFLPLIGFIILFVYLCMDSQKGANKYGPNPKELQAVEDARYAE